MFITILKEVKTDLNGEKAKIEKQKEKEIASIATNVLRCVRPASTFGKGRRSAVSPVPCASTLALIRHRAWKHVPIQRRAETLAPMQRASILHHVRQPIAEIRLAPV